MSGRDPVIPVLRPRLPSAQQLVPYLRRIDETRIYTNWGPLVLELEDRLSAFFQVARGSVVSAASGTAALSGAILAAAGRATAERPYALVPAFTFVATAIAAEQCGYEVFIAEVDRETWMLDPDRIRADVDLSRIGVVVPVAPFGRPVSQSAWLSFQEHTGVPVAIDAAASFELADPGCFGPIPVAMSFHATKSFSTGEGGCVVCADYERREDAMQALNFGFRGTRDSAATSINGKMSEYHAAIGLASLDGWPQRHTDLLQAARQYRQACVQAGLSDEIVLAPEIASCYALFSCADDDERRELEARLKRDSIGFRSWYGGGLHHETHFRAAAREPLPESERLAAGLIGVPAPADLCEADLARVVDALSGPSPTQ